MAMHLEIQKAWESERLRVYDEKSNQEVAIVGYALKHGEEAALRKIYAHKVKKYEASRSQPAPAEVVEDVMITTEPETNKAEPEPSRKELKPVEYKGNYLGGKKAIKDKIFNKTRASKALQNATMLLF